MVGEIDKSEKGTCPANGIQCEDIQKLKNLWPELEKWKEKIEAQVNGQGSAIQEIIKFQGGTKVYVEEIKEQITNLENRLFTFMADLVKNLTTKDEKSDATAANERDKQTQKWLDFAKWIIGGTIFIIVAYMFTK